jgi:predicted dienelactone hydrolase
MSRSVLIVGLMAAWWPMFITGCAGGRNAEDVYSPENFGPHSVGFLRIELYDAGRDRSLSTAVWYPARRPPHGTEPVYYLSLLAGRAYQETEVDAAGAPYPLVMFSHGNQGIGVQSFTLCEHLASQGFVVAAPNHEGNTMLDSPSDEEIAGIALERPADIIFTLDRLLELNDDPRDLLFGAIDTQALGVSGHSFGGYTTLVLAGAKADRDAAAARCAAGVAGDAMCPYVEYWPPGTVQTRPERASAFRAALALAPGGYAAFGDEGLASVDMPVMMMGGDLDEFTANDLRPIYAALPVPKYKIEITGAGHMSFTDICRAELPVPELQDLCDPERYLDSDRAFEIIDAFATAFLRLTLKDDVAMQDYLSASYAAAYPEVGLESETN